jgi:hypothetical protein
MQSALHAPARDCNGSHKSGARLAIILERLRAAPAFRSRPALVPAASGDWILHPRSSGQVGFVLTSSVWTELAAIHSDPRVSRTNSGAPKYCSASYALWARQRSSRFSARAGPPAAYGTTWWNCRNPVSVHRPFVPINAHCPPSRVQTSRFTTAGMWREADAVLRAARGRLADLVVNSSRRKSLGDA